MNAAKEMIMAAVVFVMSAAIGFAAEESAGDQSAELSKKLANPVAALISVPRQYNYDNNHGLNDDGSVSRLNIQPVIPISLNKEWNLIGRVILPLVDQNDIR